LKIYLVYTTVAAISLLRSSESIRKKLIWSNKRSKQLLLLWSLLSNGRFAKCKQIHHFIDMLKLRYQLSFFNVFLRENSNWLFNKQRQCWDQFAYILQIVHWFAWPAYRDHQRNDLGLPYIFLIADPSYFYLEWTVKGDISS
jgi:hypothetical protein